MAIGWKNESTRPAGRRTFGESENSTVASKNVRRYGRDGSKGDFPDSSTGEQPARLYRDPVPPSLPAAHMGRPGRAHQETVGFLPDGSGKFAHASHPEAEAGGVGNAVFTHAPLTPTGQAYSASGGQFGKPQKRPPSRSNAARSAQDPRGVPSSGSIRNETGTDSP
jgi:hypothetical protein